MQPKTAIHSLFGAALLCGLSAQPVRAAPIDNLTCIDDQLDQTQRAAVGGLFAEQAADPAKEPVFATGSVAAAGDFATAIGSCTDRFNWDGEERQAAEHYLIQLGRVSQIAAANGSAWASAMEAYARFGSRLLPVEGDITDHQRAMIVAGARANGVPHSTNDETGTSPIILYLQAQNNLKAARARFGST
jgi:hypothetical protein